MQKSKDDQAGSLIVEIRRGDTLYGLESRSVLELLKLPPLTAVPRQPRFLRGIFSFKGNILPVISMAALCGEDAAGQENLCILFKANGKTYALSVEDVSEMEYGGSALEMQSTAAPGSVLAICRVLDGTPPVFVLDLDQIIKTLEG